MSFCAPLANRSVIAVSGPDAHGFLQGLISNDVNKINNGQAIWAAFLTPQGKYLHDFFILEHEGKILLEVERQRKDDLLRRLAMYKLRSKVELSDLADGYQVYAAWGGGAAAEGIVYQDPRLAEAGSRIIIPSPLRGRKEDEASFGQYDLHRIKLGLPDSSRDLIPERGILLENGFEELNGVDWNKGCYMGQELTSRTKYRGLVRKRLLPCRVEGDLPASGAMVMAGDKEAGEVRSGIALGGETYCLALLRLEMLEQPLTANSAKLSPSLPPWFKMPEGDKGEAAK
ncbi:MAG: folate-binding protein YgfZ [Dongiaceae bacterium]